MTAPRLILALIFLVAGPLHFILTSMYVRIMPHWLPAHTLLVRLSGVFEILGGLGLLNLRTQRIAAWGVIALLIAVSPANIQMALDHAQWPHIPEWVLWLRVPLQLPLIYWTWRYTRR